MHTNEREKMAQEEPDERDCSDAPPLEGDPIVGELRKLYDGIAEEPVPDHLMELLRKLDEVERSR